MKMIKVKIILALERSQTFIYNTYLQRIPPLMIGQIDTTVIYKHCLYFWIYLDYMSWYYATFRT